MKIVLVSKNRELYHLCNGILRELVGNSLTFSMEEPDGAGVDADVCLWEFDPAVRFPPGMAWERAQHHFFVLHRRHLEALRAIAPCAEPNVLLKPVTRATLLAGLSRVLFTQPARGASAEAELNSVLADRDEMLQCLIQANLKLQEYDQERTNFLARAVHDFRAPLTAISGYCGLLITQQLGPLSDDQREVLQRMRHSAKRLSRMTEAMFQLSAGRNVDVPPRMQIGDIRDCIEQALHELAPFAGEKHISISVELKPAAVPLCFEREQLEQVLVNLLDNAMKVTPKSGLVELRGYPYFWERRRAPMKRNSTDRRAGDTRSPNSFRVDIRDSGPGIPAAHLERIFEEYTSYSGGHDRSSGGLGLAICRFVLNRHQGCVWAENSSGGAVFSFVLPFRTTERLPANGDDSCLEVAGSAGS